VRNLIEEAGKSQDHPTPDWLENKMRVQNMFRDSRVAITNTGRQIHQPSCAAVCVLLTAKARAQCISVPDVPWACVWCLVSQNITTKQICKSPSLWILWVVIKQWSKVPQNFWSNQNYVS